MHKISLAFQENFSASIPEDRWGKATTECKQSATVRKTKLSPSARAELAAAIRFVRHVPFVPLVSTSPSTLIGRILI
jgi:hypothetical protein